jgi:hypothetical protein
MFDKHEDKNKRQPITDNDGQKENFGKQVRPNLGKNFKLDSTAYEQEYPDKVLLKENDIDGKVQWWIDQGAEPVPRKIESRKIFKGINDKHESEWVTWHGGTQDGQPFLVYLLMMSPEDYERAKIAPQQQRQSDIRQAMKMGVGSEGDKNTYAPNLPDNSGEKGFNEIKSPGQSR